MVSKGVFNIRGKGLLLDNLRNNPIIIHIYILNIISLWIILGLLLLLDYVITILWITILFIHSFIIIIQ